ncbi:MAG: nitrogen regulation protein NR(II) [Vicinamibacterales bacterium]
MAAPPASTQLNRYLLWTSVPLTAGVFLLDLYTPADYLVSVGYVLVILLGLGIDAPRYPVLAAAAGTVLVLVSVALSGTAMPDAAAVNLSLLVLVLWVSAALLLRLRRVETHSATQVARLEELRHALDEAAIVATTDVRGRITAVNDKFCEISQYSREELIGQDHRLINSGLHPKAFMKQLWQTIGRGQIWHGEIRNRAKDGSLYWVDTTIVPFLDARGHPYQYVAIRSDITERKLGEERLRQQEALARVGQLAAMVAHEVKNPLAGIKAALQVMVSRRPAGDPDAPVMHEIIERADALNDLISDLLQFSRPKPPQLQLLELRGVVEEAQTLLGRDPVGAGVASTIVGPEVALHGDRAMLRSVFSNLFINAAQAMGGSGSLAVELTTGPGQVQVTIRDSGPGIPDDVRERVFEPFFTTKARGGGLGLAIAKRSVELHGGTLTLDCPPGGGTRATVTLPAQTSLPD